MANEKLHAAIVGRCGPESRGSNVIRVELYLERSKVFQAEPGQFVVIGHPLHERSVMPRPFSIADAENGSVTLLVKEVGRNTGLLTQLREEDRVNLYGPQGTPITIDPTVRKYILVGGGIGGAALVFLAKCLVQAGKEVLILLGARNESELAGISFFEWLPVPLQTITDHGHGRNGFVTELLEEALVDDGQSSTVIACGPPQMLEKTAEICARYGNQCLVMLERVMACGMGSCFGCVIPCVDGSRKLACKDGPTIDARLIDWPAYVRSLLVPTQTQLIMDEADKRSPAEINLRCNLAGLELEYPTMNASGCLDIGALEDGSYDYSRLGAIVPKGIMFADTPGNDAPRVCETYGGMINAIGLQNKGVEHYKKELLARYRALGKPVIQNISGKTLEEYALLAQALDDTEIDAVEVNISCPNIKEGGMVFGTDPRMTYKVVQAVRKTTSKRVIVKLSPNVTNIVDIARAAVDGGADLLSLINTILAMSIDVKTRRPKIRNIMGGQSGPSIHPVLVRMVHQINKANLGVQMIGMGGIHDGDSATQVFIAGASAVAVGTAGFSNRRVVTDIVEYLEQYLPTQGFTSISQLVGSTVMD